ncbi:hypothetical protein GCM10022237_48150 [Nocardioides ginsengisoli]|uniref:Nuclear transport factor 2 family protein n=1 Tax=Nocardioides ginsengisoli TaxID=363868 RepID=A0ABW3W478_9ACTN
MHRRFIAALVLPFALTACGSDDKPAATQEPTSEAPSEAPSEATSEATSESPSTVETEVVAGDLSAADQAAISTTIREFLVTGDCDLATTEYLRSIALFADESTPREEACTSWESVFSKPLFTQDDVQLTELQGENGVATVKVGSKLANITTLYQLTEVDGTWLVSGDEFNTDGL